MGEQQHEDVGLGRLLEDLVRDGWLMGMNAGVDPVVVRMDAPTGVYNRPHFISLVDRAVGDVRGGFQRAEDGPAAGAVAVLSVRILDWEGIGAHIGAEVREELAARVARLLEGVLRVDDVLARTAEDVFSLLLRGCPDELHEPISGRCRRAVEAERYEGDGVWHQLRCVAVTQTWDGESADELLDASFELLIDG